MEKGDTSLRIVFMGTPHFAVPALEALIHSHHKVVAVYTQPPRPAGRGYVLQKSPVQECAEKHCIEVYTPENFKKEGDITIFQHIKADIAVVAAYGLLLPKAILETPRFGCINIHASLLPRWRGAAPIQRAIMAGDDETGICIMRMEEGLDTGPVMLRGATLIHPQSTTRTVHDTLAQMGAEMIVGAVDMIAEGVAIFKDQDNSRATYAKKIKKEEGLIDWTNDAFLIDRQIRALTPQAWCDIPQDNAEPLRLKIIESHYLPDIKAPAGMLINNEGIVACGKGGLKLITVQPPSKKPMNFSAFINGHALKQGVLLHTGKMA